MRRAATPTLVVENPPDDFSLYAAEEAILGRSEMMLTQLSGVSEGVRELARAYRRGFREQQRLVRMSDRMQLDLHLANQQLAEQTRELTELNAKLSAEIERRSLMAQELKRLAETDDLTGTFSRRRFLELAERQWTLRAGSGRPACVLMLDLDRFKLLNDGHGHFVGDEALATFGRICLGHLRSTDIMGRVGGEEFAIVMPETGLGTASLLAEELRSLVAGASVPSGSDSVALTVSIGLAEGRDGETLSVAMSRADLALYEAKRAGRNRVRPELRAAPAPRDGA